MPNPEQPQGQPTRAAEQFATTHWSVVGAAGDRRSSLADAALEKLRRTYWSPLYAYIRRRGYGEHDAQDLTQEFFARLLEKNYPGQADPRKGKFRSFLLLTLNHFLSDERAKARAQKRGGGQTVLSLDAQAAEARYRLEPMDEVTPEKIFERRWAQAVLDQAVTRLRGEYAAAGRSRFFDVLQRFQPGEQAALSYAEAAAQLGVSEGAVKTLIHRLRQRHQQLVGEEVAHTVTTAAEVDEELRLLIRVMTG